jgi:hypothetical protein
VTTKQTTRKYPAPLYAAAGAGDLAYRTLRTIPAKVAELRGRSGAPEFDVEKLRGVARRNAAAFVAGAQAAQEKAVAIYTDLVARGEQVVAGGAKATEAKVIQIASAVETDAAQTTKATAKPAARTTPAKATRSTRPANGK